jgi:tetratricopeptide (TPR) repeat protein
MTKSKGILAADHSVAVGGSALGDIVVGHDIAHIEDKPQTPPYIPPSLPEPGTIPEPGPLPPGSRMLFQRNVNFTGRENQLEALAQALLYREEAMLVTQTVQGMGGVGKTQLAVEFAYRYGRFFHGVHWINAAQPNAIGAEIAACGRAMELQPWPEMLSDQVMVTLRAWQRGGLKLVILDKLEQVDVAQQWLGRLDSASLCVLITTRRIDWPSNMNLRPLQLDLFSPAESRAFLRQHLPQADAQALDALAKRLGHLPLALELAGRYLKRHRRKRVEDYLAELDQALTHRSMQGWREELGSSTDHDLDVAVTFALSWKEVESGTAQRLFLIAGYCAPNEPIPYELLERAAELDQDECDEALDYLTGLGLLELEAPDLGPTIHPLLAEYARALLPLPSPEIGRGERVGVRGEGLSALADALVKMTYQANETGLPERFQPLRPHTRAVAEWAEESDLEQAGALWSNLGYHLKMVADYAGARAAYERALHINEDAFGSMPPEVATALNNLGSVLQDLGDLAGARAAYERALHIDEDAFGPMHPEVATALNNLGSVLQDLGDLAGARAAYERALHIDEDAFGPMHPEVAIHVNNLGSVLQDMGDLEGARASFERALRIDEAVYGLDHPNVARDVNNLGLVQKAQGDLISARASFDQRQLELPIDDN